MSEHCVALATTTAEMQVLLQPAWVLHSRAYRDSSLLVDVLTLAHGRVSLIAKGVQRPRRRGDSLSSALQPFTPLLVSYKGRSGLKTLIDTEAQRATLRLKGERLYSAMYLNELLTRLLQQDDTCPSVFQSYGATLECLATDAPLEKSLRAFEWALLAELGYAVDLSCDGSSGKPIDEQGEYCYCAEYGVVAATGVGGTQMRYRGADLLAISSGIENEQANRVEKMLMREMLGAQLGPKPLYSRELFRVNRTKV